jgi:hypothetical protein
MGVNDLKLRLIAVMCIIAAVLLCGCSSGAQGSNPTGQTGSDEKDSNIVSTAAAEDSFVLGKLVTVNDGTPFRIDGLRLDGNLTDEEKNGRLPDTYGIRSNFVLNEKISFFIDTDYRNDDAEDVKTLCLKHRAFSRYRGMSAKELKEESAFIERFRAADEDMPNFRASVSDKKFDSGDYDIIFTYKGSIVYYVVVHIADKD